MRSYGSPVTVRRSPEPFDRWSRATDGPLLVLALGFLVVLLLPLYRPDLPASLLTGLRTVNALLWLAFGVDYLVRLYLAPDRAQHFRTHLADLLLLVVPFLRPLRLLRVVGLLGAASRRAGSQALVTVGTMVVVGELVLVVVAAGLVLDAERNAMNANIIGVQDALWWAASTVTTAGYGDHYPVTGLGRLVAVGLMLGGIALLGVVTASLATWFVQRFRSEQSSAADVDDGLRAALLEVSERLARLEETLRRHNASAS